MDAMTPAFRKHSEVIQSEHQELLQRLGELDAALDEMVCYSEVFADLASSARLRSTGSWLSQWLPAHFDHEEKTVLASMARMRPDLATFAREMKRQHREIGERLQAFCRVVEGLQTAADIQESVCDLKDRGKDLTLFVSQHMGAEERKMSGLHPPVRGGPGHRL